MDRVDENIDLNGMSFIYIIAENLFLKFMGSEDEKTFTLKDCYDIVLRDKPDNQKVGVIIVLVEYPLDGAVYRYGNHGEYWEKIGTLKGFA